MNDTQWPRFEVFLQETPGGPYGHTGSVHAPDAEIAILNARDVFVRRPECSSLWVAPANAIRGGTAEQLAARGSSAEKVPGPATDFLVFAKLEARGTLTHVGQVRAESEAEALREGARLAGTQAPLVLWVVPVDRVTASEADQADSLFTPALERPFRHQGFYPIHTALRRLRRGSGK